MSFNGIIRRDVKNSYLSIKGSFNSHSEEEVGNTATSQIVHTYKNDNTVVTLISVIGGSIFFQINVNCNNITVKFDLSQKEYQEYKKYLDTLVIPSTISPNQQGGAKKKLSRKSSKVKVSKK